MYMHVNYRYGSKWFINLPKDTAQITIKPIPTFDAKVSWNTDLSYTHSVHLTCEETLDLYCIIWHLSYL